MWVSGTTYPIGKQVISPANLQAYIRKTDGAGATDPSTDTTNWVPFGGRTIKSIQRGTLQIFNGSGTNTGSVTISTVVPAKTELRMLGYTDSNPSVYDPPRIALSSINQITGVRNASSGTTVHTISWELTEYY